MLLSFCSLLMRWVVWVVLFYVGGSVLIDGGVSVGLMFVIFRMIGLGYL